MVGDDCPVCRRGHDQPEKITSNGHEEIRLAFGDLTLFSRVGLIGRRSVGSGRRGAEGRGTRESSDSRGEAQDLG